MKSASSRMATRSALSRAARATFASSINERRSHRSAIAPAGNAKSSHGRVYATVSPRSALVIV
jgi:hypothetical protein